jgi:hypothetical protein
MSRAILQILKLLALTGQLHRMRFPLIRHPQNLKLQLVDAVLDFLVLLLDKFALSITLFQQIVMNELILYKNLILDKVFSKTFFLLMSDIFQLNQLALQLFLDIQQLQLLTATIL